MMSNIPKKWFKLVRGLSDYVSTVLDEVIVDKNDMLSRLPDNVDCVVFGQIFGKTNFRKVVKDFTDNEFNKLIATSNVKINEGKVVAAREKVALEKLERMLAEDKKTKDTNVMILELVEFDKKYYGIKVCLPCGTRLLEGAVWEIVRDIKEILAENEVEPHRVECPQCSSHKLRFWEVGEQGACLCYDCGSLSTLDDGDEVVKYDGDQEFWGAQAIVEVARLQNESKGFPELMTDDEFDDDWRDELEDDEE